MRLLTTSVLLASCAIAQTTAVKSPTVMPQGSVRRQGIRQASLSRPPAAQAKTANVPPDTPVVTLHGVCKDRQAKSPCQTVVTREDLDRFVNSIAPEASEATRSRLAVQYARTLALSALAEQQGLEKNPVLAKEIDADVKLVRMRILATALLQSLQNQPASSGDAETQKYYDEHRDQYQQVQVRRLSVPTVVPTENGRPLDRSVVKAELDELRVRALAGEDFNRLQEDAYKHLHIQATPPPVNLMTLRRSNVQGEEAKAFDLNPGEISPVLDLAAALALVKVESKEPMSIGAARQEIEAGLRGSRLQNQVSKLGKKVSAEFNLQYLGMPSQPDLFGQIAVNPAASVGNTRRATGTRP